MSDTLQFDLVSPERLLLSREVAAVQLPGQEGDFGVLPGHSAVISVIRPGILSVSHDGRQDDFYIRGGFADVTPNGLTVLAEHAVELTAFDAASRAAELDYARGQLTEDASDQTRLMAQTIIDLVEAL